MAIRVSNLRLQLDAPETALPEHLARILGTRAVLTCPWRILRKSLDARDKGHLQFVYSVEVHVPEDEDRLVQQARRTTHPEARVESFAEAPFQLPPSGS